MVDHPQEDMTPIQKAVWCHVFFCNLSGAAASERSETCAAVCAEKIADRALDILRHRGLVRDAHSVIADRVLCPSGDSIPIVISGR